MASWRHERFLQPCHTSKSWGFQPTTTSSSSVRCARLEQKRTSARTTGQIDSSITCSPSGHSQKERRKVDPCSRFSLFDSHVRLIAVKNSSQLFINCRFPGDGPGSNVLRWWAPTPTAPVAVTSRLRLLLAQQRFLRGFFVQTRICNQSVCGPICGGPALRVFHVSSRTIYRRSARQSAGS